MSILRYSKVENFKETQSFTYFKRCNMLKKVTHISKSRHTVGISKVSCCLEVSTFIEGEHFLCGSNRFNLTGYGYTENSALESFYIILQTYLEDVLLDNPNGKIDLVREGWECIVDTPTKKIYKDEEFHKDTLTIRKHRLELKVD